jgi:serine/threonine-protein kinase HipA
MNSVTLMATNADRLIVHLHGEPIAELARGRSRSAVSLNWNLGFTPGPVRLTEAFSVIPEIQPPERAASNWLGGYAPEGNQRLAMAEARGVRPDDLFALLREFGGSIAGAVTISPPEEPAEHRPRYVSVKGAMVERRLRQAIDRHDLGAHDDSRSMIPGFQPKVLLARIDNRWQEPHGRAHSTHILKPRLSSRPEAIPNEYYGYQLARAMGMATYSAELGRFGDQIALVVERFDRRILDGEVQLVHQEDLAQALGVDWLDAAAKFQDQERPRRQDRPSARSIAELLATIPDSPGLAAAWLDRLAFAVLIGDNDAHAKNVSLLHEPGGTRLADAYDCVPNLHQPGRIAYDLALSVDGVFDQRRISVERLESEAASWGVLPRHSIRARLESTVTAFAAAVETVAPPRGATPELRRRFVTTAERLLAGGEIGDPES